MQCCTTVYTHIILHTPRWNALNAPRLFNTMTLGCSFLVPLPHLDIVCFGALSVGKEREVIVRRRQRRGEGQAVNDSTELTGGTS